MAEDGYLSVYGTLARWANGTPELRTSCDARPGPWRAIMLRSLSGPTHHAPIAIPDDDGDIDD
jgi:hypothetical protein